MKTNPSMSLDSTGYYSDSNYCEICSSPDKLTSDCPLVNLTRGFDGKRDFELSRVYGVAVESICMRICPLSQPVQNFELRVSTSSICSGFIMAISISRCSRNSLQSLPGLGNPTPCVSLRFDLHLFMHMNLSYSP